ncbi:MAG: cohesin domain-containing protein [Anaerolineae bacterium]
MHQFVTRAPKIGWLSILLAGALAIFAIAFSPASTRANSQATVHPDPLALGLKSGDQGTLAIRIDNAESLYGVELHLSFDPQVVEVVDTDSAKEGAQLKPGDWFKGGFVAVNKADNAKGTIDYAVTLLNPAPALSGSGTVATITFKGKNNGTSPLTITHAILATRQAQEIKADWQNGAIGVSLLGQAPQVQVTTSGPSTTNAGNSNSQGAPASSALPTNLILIGVAGLAILGFLGALVLVGALFILRRR